MESMFKNVLEDEGTINERENEPSIQLQGNSVDKFFNNITQAQGKFIKLFSKKIKYKFQNNKQYPILPKELFQLKNWKLV